MTTPPLPPCPTCGRPTAQLVELAPFRSDAAVGCPACLEQAVDAAILVRVHGRALLKW